MSLSMANEPEQPPSSAAPTLLEIEGEDLLPEFLRRPKSSEEGTSGEAGSTETPAPVSAEGAAPGEPSVEAEADEEPEVPVRVSKRVPPKNVQDLLSQEVLYRAESAGDKLRALLPGLIMLTLDDSQKCYTFSWKGPQAAVEGPLEPAAAQSITAD